VGNVDFVILVAICSLIVATITLLHRFGIFGKTYNYLQERKVRNPIKISFSPPEGKIKWQDGNGLVNIFVVLSNMIPHKMFTNVQGKFWTDEAIYRSSTNIRPVKIAPTVPYLYFNFRLDILHKKTSVTLSTLTLVVPKKKGEYILGADLIASELNDWKAFGYPLKVENDMYKIKYR
jgi:hypothetical protein